VRWTTSATILAALQQAWVWHAWAVGDLPYTATYAAAPLTTLLWILTMPYWRIVCVIQGFGCY
jgi:hypothetical protein